MKFIDWTRLYEKYKGLWVALDDDNESVVGAGTTPEQALEEAHAKGFARATLTFVPSEVIAFAGHHAASVHEASARV